MNIKVISFNIRCCHDKDGHSIPERAPRLLKSVKPYDADIIGFQEYTEAWDTEIKRDFGDKYEINNVWRAESNHESAPILWKKDKFECLDKGHFWFSDTPEVESRGWDELFNCYRICQWVILRENESGKVFTYMNTHFGFGDKGQCDSVKLLVSYAKKISTHPTFATGDFNMNPSSLAYAEMIKHMTDANAVTLNDLSDTYHGYDLSVERDSHIDYCFTNESVNPVLTKVINDTFDGKFPSDHFGLYFELNI